MTNYRSRKNSHWRMMCFFHPRILKRFELIVPLIPSNRDKICIFRIYYLPRNFPFFFFLYNCTEEILASKSEIRRVYAAAIHQTAPTFYDNPPVQRRDRRDLIMRARDGWNGRRNPSFSCRARFTHATAPTYKSYLATARYL